VNKLLLLCTVTLAGCASSARVSDYQEECNSQHQKFSEQVGCANQKVMADTRSKSDSTMEYVYLSKVLVERVEKGEITENEARLTLIKRQGEINAAESEARARIARNIAESFKPQPVDNSAFFPREIETTCQDTGWGTVKCNSRDTSSINRMIAGGR